MKNKIFVKVRLPQKNASLCLEVFSKIKLWARMVLSTEFYLRFWNVISCPLINCLNHSALVGELSISQRQGIISLIPKKNKDPLLLKNWHPITLLNVDYKLATKCIARHLEVLPHLIERDQMGHIKGRYITINICAISDTIEQHKNKEGMILFLDFEKAFDSLEWDYLFKVLDIMNFGPSFLNWIHTFYKNISSCYQQWLFLKIFVYKEE